MALATYQVQGSYATFPYRPTLWRRGMEAKQFFSRPIVVKRKSCLCVGDPRIQGSKRNSLRILSFKGKVDESEGRASGSKSAKNSVEYSYVPHNSEESVVESAKGQNGPVSSLPEADLRQSGSIAIQNLFKSWLTLLHAPSPQVVVDGILEGAQSLRETSEIKNVTLSKGRGEILKALWCHFLRLDSTIKIPLMIFVPMYVLVNLIYGAEVSKELTPLWKFAPLVVAVYIGMFKLLCAVYAFTFSYVVKVLKIMSAYVQVIYNFVVSGELIRVCFWQTLAYIRNFPKIVKAQWEAKKVKWEEEFVDTMETIWPYYCRTIKALKRAKIL